MLVELSVMEQRYQAVLAVVQDGWKVLEGRRAPRGVSPDRPSTHPSSDEEYAPTSCDVRG